MDPIINDWNLLAALPTPAREWVRFKLSSQKQHVLLPVKNFSWNSNTAEF